jgi:hypothetical protein
MNDKSKPFDEEARRTRIFPGIAFRGEDWDRRPWVIGSAFDAWQVVDAFRDIGSVEAMVAEGNLSEQQIRLALAYYSPSSPGAGGSHCTREGARRHGWRRRARRRCG